MPFVWSAASFNLHHQFMRKYDSKSWLASPKKYTWLM
uniref:Uncharacterized protein n=1 Tax=Cucumis melo TaxID=3656 RepID=A0A9I9EMG6_CUCME